MRTIEEIRLENFRALITELQEDLGTPDITAAEISMHFGISSVYAWQLKFGKRDKIDSVAARKIESKYGKPHGWMDTDFKLWPFPDIDQERFASLKGNQKIEIQGQVRGWIEKFESENAAEAQRKTGSDR